ncbi:hypothetical protein [Desulfovibrio inopinatus]|uniref:hypothetical protein n=1 Tax=Desulfovibrio inopinatus TaxID=102109 RepID=UPI00041E2E75|nr:hypothetical protein [Desulfovibrio inopinatus]
MDAFNFGDMTDTISSFLDPAGIGEAISQSAIFGNYVGPGLDGGNFSLLPVSGLDAAAMIHDASTGYSDPSPEFADVYNADMEFILNLSNAEPESAYESLVIDAAQTVFTVKTMVESVEFGFAAEETVSPIVNEIVNSVGETLVDVLPEGIGTMVQEGIDTAYDGDITTLASLFQSATTPASFTLMPNTTFPTAYNLIETGLGLIATSS